MITLTTNKKRKIEKNHFSIRPLCKFSEAPSELPSTTVNMLLLYYCLGYNKLNVSGIITPLYGSTLNWLIS